MNFIKRAGRHLWARKVRSLLLIGLFFVICSLVLSGLLLRAATGQAADAAKQDIGSDVTLEWDMDKAMADGQLGMTLPEDAVLDTGQADRAGDTPLVTDYNYTLEGGTVPSGVDPVQVGEAPPDLPEEMAEDSMFPLAGIRDLELLHDFKTGSSTIVDGDPITKADADRDVVMVEERLADLNELEVGDEVTLTSADGKNPRPFEIVGVYSDPEKSPQTWVAPQAEPGNMMYVPVDAIGRLNPDETVGDEMRINQAVYELKDPGKLDEFREHAADSGIDMDVFKLDANDKLYRELIGPIEGVAGFASVGVWLIAIAGAAILALLVMMGVRERRTELGVLLSIGERRWRLVGQHLAEILAVAALALGLSIAVGQSLSQWAGDTLLADQVASASDDQAGEQQGAAPMAAGPQGPEPDVDPVDEISVSMRTSDALAIAGIGLGIAAVATVLPAFTILRYQPRSILAKGD